MTLDPEAVEAAAKEINAWAFQEPYDGCECWPCRDSWARDREIALADARRILTAALSVMREKELPKGYALVPIKPTEDMLWVGRESILTCTKEDPCGKAAEHCWADMVGAAPTPPKAGT
jgi:hypothetical protein